MKTNLPEQIDSVQEAKDFLKEMVENGEIYHPKEDAFDIVWKSPPPTEDQMILLNKLMFDIENLEDENFNALNYILSIAFKNFE
jgi:hypothetical protein